jgi:hypothetical protein
MPEKKEPSDKPAAREAEIATTETVSLVDFFDQIDRKAFQRALEHRDSTPYHQSSR